MAYKSNAKEIAYEFILDKIKKGDWKSNEKIWTEDILVQTIGVSRVAVRDAVEKLAGMGVLRKIQGSGTFVEGLDDIALNNMSVIAISYEELMQLLEFRKYLEPATVEMFIKHATDEDIQQLEDYYNKMVECVDDVEAFYKADYAFHRMLAKGSDNIFVLKVNDLLVDILENHQKNLYNSVGPEIGIDYHRLILKYVKERDVELASLYMKKHMEATIEARLKIRRPNEGDIEG